MMITLEKTFIFNSRHKKTQKQKLFWKMSTSGQSSANNKIILQCVKVGRKLRIRFHSFTDHEGKVFTGVYNQSYNTMFPRDIREEGKYYEIGANDLTLISQTGKAPFYRVNKANIRPLATAVDMSKLKIFEVEECIICYSETPNIILVPCGHLCCCAECYKALQTGGNAKSCPICRRKVDTTCVHEPSTTTTSFVGAADDDESEGAITNGITTLKV